MPSGPRAGRVYLNPKNEYVPIIAYEIMLRATEQGRPIYFKIADQAFFRGYGTPEKTRMDKILFYVPKEDLAFVIDLAKSLAGTNPEAFEGRPTNPMLSPVAPGIGYGADVTAAQKSRSTTGSASFSQVRANLLGDLWENTVANILAEYWESTNPKASAMKASFVRSLASGIGADGKFCGKTVDIAREATMLRKARFNWEAYRDQGGILWKNNICNALGETAIGHFPKLSATSLYQWSSAVLPAVAAKHGIDPDDLARNIAEKP